MKSAPLVRSRWRRSSALTAALFCLCTATATAQSTPRPRPGPAAKAAPTFSYGQSEAAMAFATESMETMGINAFAQEELARAGGAYVEAAAVYETVDGANAATLL